MAIKIFYDLETSGLNPEKNGIIEAYFESDTADKEKLYLQINPGAVEYAPSALAINGYTMEQITKHIPALQAACYISMYLQSFKDRIMLVGYNNNFFDDKFLKQLLTKYVLVEFSKLQIEYRDVYTFVKDRKPLIPPCPNYKLSTVAKALGVDVDSQLLHGSRYDTMLTIEVYTRLCAIIRGGTYKEFQSFYGGNTGEVYNYQKKVY